MNLFKKLFRGNPKLPPINLAELGVDIHSHLIPGIDDGVETLEKSLEVILEFKKWGIEQVVTTPHIMSDFYKNTPEIILGGLKKLRDYLAENQVSFTIDAAAEYYLDFDFEKKIEEESLLTFGDKFVLFELPFIQEPQNLTSAIFKMQTAGYRPILAHPERYTFWSKDWDKYTELRDKGVLFQLNLVSLTGCYSPEVKKIAEKLIDENMVDWAGTDCHGMNHVNLVNNSLALPYTHKLFESGNLLNKTLLAQNKVTVTQQH